MLSGGDSRRMLFTDAFKREREWGRETSHCRGIEKNSFLNRLRSCNLILYLKYLDKNQLPLYRFSSFAAVCVKEHISITCFFFMSDFIRHRELYIQWFSLLKEGYTGMNCVLVYIKALIVVLSVL